MLYLVNYNSSWHQWCWCFNVFYWQDRTAYKFLLFPSILLLLRWWIWDGCLPAWAVQIYQVSCLYYSTPLIFLLITALSNKNSLNSFFPLIRLGYYSCTQALLCGRMYWLQMEVTFVHGKGSSTPKLPLRYYNFWLQYLSVICKRPFIARVRLSFLNFK